MICAPSPSRMSWGTPLTDATVPTGIKTGVSTAAWGVTRRPVRALRLVLWIENSSDMNGQFYPRPEPETLTGGRQPRREAAGLGCRQRKALAAETSPDDPLQGDDFRTHLVVTHNQPADSHRKLESTRTGAPGIEIERTIPNLLLRYMAVPVYHNSKSGCLWLQIKPCEIVQDVNRDLPNFHHLGLRES